MKTGAGPRHYASLAGGVGAVLVGLLAALRPAPRNWPELLWVPLAVLALALLGYTYGLLLPYLHDQAAALRVARRELGARRVELQRLRETLRFGHLAFRAEALNAEAERLRQELTTSAGSLAALVSFQRLLQIEGPDSPAWLGLARTWLAIGRPESALRCAAEAVRAGLAEPELLRQVAEVGAGAGYVASGTAGLAALVVDCFRARLLDPERLAALYRELAEWPAARVLQLVLWRELLDQVGDREEVARQVERLTTRPVIDDELSGWLHDAWIGYRVAPGWNTSTATAERPVWESEVPAPWRAALGLVPVAAGRRYRDALTDLSADEAEPASPGRGGPLPPTPVEVRNALASRLWPRSRRSLAQLQRALDEIVGLPAPAARAAGLEQLTLALAEERDPELEGLAGELAGIAESMPPGAPRVRALCAAGLALEARDEQAARDYWKQAMEAAEELLEEQRRELLSDFPAIWPRLGEQGAKWLAESAVVLLDAPGEVITQLLLVTGRHSPDLLARLSRDRSRLPPQAQFLLAWQERDLRTLVESLALLWRAGEGAAWLPLAAARLAEPGDEQALRLGLALMRREALRDAVAAAGWLAFAHRLDGLEERPTWPEGQRAVAFIAKLQAARLSDCLPAIEETLRAPTPAWVDAVELAFLRRLGRHRAISPEEAVAEVAATRQLLRWLGPARLTAQIGAWTSRYRDRLAAWSEDLLDVGTSR